jgi:hypothetical protein
MRSRSEWQTLSDVSEKPTASIISAEEFPTLKMEAAPYPETSTNMYHTK